VNQFVFVLVDCICCLWLLWFPTQIFRTHQDMFKEDYSSCMDDEKTCTWT